MEITIDKTTLYIAVHEIHRQIIEHNAVNGIEDDWDIHLDSYLTNIQSKYGDEANFIDSCTDKIAEKYIEWIDADSLQRRLICEELQDLFGLVGEFLAVFIDINATFEALEK